MKTYMRFGARLERNSLNIYQRENVSDKICKENGNTLFCLINVFSKSERFSR
jgi:hypothetical protein